MFDTKKHNFMSNMASGGATAEKHTAHFEEDYTPLGDAVYFDATADA